MFSTMFLLPYEYYHADAIVHIPHSFKKKKKGTDFEGEKILCENCRMDGVIMIMADIIVQSRV